MRFQQYLRQVAGTGFEPATSRLWGSRATIVETTTFTG